MRIPDASKIVTGEATALNALYRDVSSYTEPIRMDLQKELRDYVDQVIHQAWPLQRRGQIPTAGIEYMSRFQARFDAFEPTSEGQKLLHGEMILALDRPFRGDLGLLPEPYQLVYDQLMKP